MKQKKNLLFALVSLSIGLFFSCNNNKPKSEEETTVTPPVTDNSHGPMQTLAAANSFCTLKLDSASLVTLLADNSTKKLLVQFIDSSSSSTCMNLIAYGSKTSNVITSGPVGLVALSNSPTTFNGTVILGDQELTIKSIKTVLGLNGSGKINASKLKSLQFVPLKDGSNHIYYSVTVLGMTEASGSALTNPSPPAPPCENGCDYQ